MLRHQHAAAGINVKSARVDRLRFDVLNLRVFTGVLIDRVNNDAVFTALVNFAPLEIHHILRAV